MFKFAFIPPAAPVSGYYNPCVVSNGRATRSGRSGDIFDSYL